MLTLSAIVKWDGQTVALIGSEDLAGSHVVLRESSLIRRHFRTAMLFSDESISEWRYPTKSLDYRVLRQLASRQDRNRVTMHFR